MVLCASSAGIAKPGDFRTVQIGRESILISRSRSRKGEARAFFNICRHRGAKLCSSESGEGARSFQCPYHAWTYDLDGKLIAAPNLTKMPDIGREEYGLRKVHVREWLVWVSLAEEPPSFEETVIGDVRTRLGDVESLEHYDVDKLALAKRITYDVKANWKLIIDNFMECYHCATIHPELTEVLPEFADGHGALFGDDVQGFTVDGSEGHEKIPGVTEDQDRRYYAVTVRRLPGVRRWRRARAERAPHRLSRVTLWLPSPLMPSRAALIALTEAIALRSMQAIKTMRDTGRDMKDKYKETARGGLAVNVIEC